MRTTRRTFLKTVAAFTASRPLAALAESADPREPLQQFEYGRVKLTGGPFAEQYQAIHAHYLGLSNDRLLKVYRQRAGLPAPGADMGGWYDLNGFVPGHSLGQYISGLARIGATTGDLACHEKVHALVQGFAQTLGKDNQSILRPQTNLWTCFTLDRHFNGLIDAYMFSGMTDAKDLLDRVLAGSEKLLPAKGRDRIGKTNLPYDEPFIMPENLFIAARLTGNSTFDELARRYLLDREFFDPLANGANPFPGQHAYSHAIALSSGAGAYLALGDAKYKQAMEKAFMLLTTQQQFASGGWGPNETFITPYKGELYDALSSTADHFETPCGSYAATKLARYLTRFTVSPADTRYGDNMERVLYNTILAVKMPDTEGDYPYYSTYSRAAKKVYYQKKWPCCSGTLVQTVADYPLNLYFKSADGLYVTQYTPSELAFEHGAVPVKLVQETGYPLQDSTSITLKPAQPVAFVLYLRVPAWLTQKAEVTVNGKLIPHTASAGSYLAINRLWKAGDRVTLTLSQSFRTEAIDELHSETVALMRGPVQYVALAATDHVNRSPLTLPASLKQIAPQTFAESYDGVQIIFVPLYMVRDETYTAYFSKA